MFANKYSWAITGVLIGGIIGFAAANAYLSQRKAAFFDEVYPLRTEAQLQLVRPLFAYETPDARELPQYDALETRLERYIEEVKGKGTTSTVSVYYRDLQNGRWIGIEENKTFHPASLLKVPLMIAYFKQTESRPWLMKYEIPYRPISGESPYEMPSTLTAGETYTVEELIERMIIDSDNGATYTLFDNIEADRLANVYTDIGIPDPEDNSAQYQISTKTYARFFRILYNATYLTPSMSERALELLTRTTYHNGLTASLEKDVTAAHKWGEHVVTKNDAAVAVELHDCGIVYHPKHDYLLCVMTNVATERVAEEITKSISGIVYDFVQTESSP